MNRILKIAAFAGQFGENEVDALIQNMKACKSVSEAVELFDQFTNSGDYFQKMLVSALANALAEGETAHLQDLQFFEGIKRFFEMCHQENISRAIMLQILAKGDAVFEGDISDLLKFWARLGNQRGEKIALPEDLNKVTILEYVYANNSASQKAEGDWAPRSPVHTDSSSINLYWEGTWTQNRWVSITINFDSDGLVINAAMSWQTGTGEPSTFLRIERLLSLPSVKSFSTL